MPKLTKDELNTFLAGFGIGARIAVIKPSGTPLIVPISYFHRDDCIYFTPRAKSAWYGYMKENPNICMCIDDFEHPVPKVVVEGQPELVHDLGENDSWRDFFREMMERYATKEIANDYVDNTIDQDRSLWRLVLADCKVTSWRVPMGDEDPTGIWHHRYYGDDTDYGKKSKL